MGKNVSQWTKKKGAVEYMIALFIITLVAVLVLYSVRIRVSKNYKYIVKDGLDAACLAAALINLDVYGAQGRIEIDDFHTSFQTFQEHLKKNLKLEDDFGESITIHQFAIYNILESKITKIEYLENGMVLTETMDYTGQEKTPNGKLIQGATVYAKVGTEMKGFISGKQYVYEDSCIDIAE